MIPTETIRSLVKFNHSRLHTWIIDTFYQMEFSLIVFSQKQALRRRFECKSFIERWYQETLVNKSKWSTNWRRKEALKDQLWSWWWLERPRAYSHSENSGNQPRIHTSSSSPSGWRTWGIYVPSATSHWLGSYQHYFSNISSLPDMSLDRKGVSCQKNPQNNWKIRHLDIKSYG